MTKDTESETKTNSEPIPIGFLPAYLPNSTVEIVSEIYKKDIPPYPVDISGGTFPVPHSHNFPSSSQNNSLGVKLIGKSLPSPLDESASALSIIDLNNEKGLTNFEREEIMIALSKMESKVLGKSTKETKQFFNEQNKVIDIIDVAKSRISKEEKDNFYKQLKRINEMRMEYLKEEAKNKNEEIDKIDTEDNGERNNKCSFDITSLFLKFPQLVVDIVIGVKSGITGLTTISGATFFTISLTAALFTSYFLTLHCICIRTKLTRISEFLHSFMCTLVFMVVSVYCTDDEQLRAFGFLASVPYGSEVCWKSWKFLKKQHFFRFPDRSQ